MVVVVEEAGGPLHVKVEAAATAEHNRKCAGIKPFLKIMIHCKAGERDHCADPLALTLLLFHLLLTKLLLVDLLRGTLLRCQEDLPKLTCILVLIGRL